MYKNHFESRLQRRRNRFYPVWLQFYRFGSSGVNSGLMIGQLLRVANKEMSGLRVLEQGLFSSLNSWSLFSCWFRNLKHWGNCSLWNCFIYFIGCLYIESVEIIFNLKFNIKFLCCARLLQTCLILCDPMDCSLPDSSVHGILQARILEWVALSFSRGSSRPRTRTRVSCLLHWQADSLPLVPPGNIAKVFQP